MIDIPCYWLFSPRDSKYSQERLYWYDSQRKGIWTRRAKPENTEPRQSVSLKDNIYFLIFAACTSQRPGLVFFAFFSLSTNISKIVYKLSSSSQCIGRECKSKNTFSALLQTACATEMSETSWQDGLFVASGFHFHQMPSQLWIPTHLEGPNPTMH